MNIEQKRKKLRLYQRKCRALRKLMNPAKQLCGCGAPAVKFDNGLHLWTCARCAEIDSNMDELHRDYCGVLSRTGSFIEPYRLAFDRI